MEGNKKKNHINIFQSISPYHQFLVWLKIKLLVLGNSLAVQWLGLRAFTSEGLGSIPGWGTNIPEAVWYSQKKKKKIKLLVLKV